MGKYETKITMLGTGNAVVTKCYNTCFCLHTEKGIFLVDAGGGNGILSQLEKANIPLTDIHELFISHAHTDHLLGAVWIIRAIAQLMQKNAYSGNLNVYGHDKVIEVTEWICKSTLPKKIVAFIGNRIILNKLNKGDSFHAAGVYCTCFDIESTKEKQYGLRIEYDKNKVLAFLGDEPYNPNNKEYVENADWMMSEAFCLYRDRDIFKPYEKHHSTAIEAARTAASLGIKNLILYHTEDKTIAERKIKYTEEAKLEFKNPVYVPDDLESITL